jgi:hypothetical protein
VKKGVIYVEVPNEANQFPNELAKALNLDYSPLIGLRSFITKKILGSKCLNTIFLKRDFSGGTSAK